MPLGSAALLAVVLTLMANDPPLTPTIIEPPYDGITVNPEDAHMASAPFSDPDPGDTHAASDWEIWTISPSQRIWSALGVTGAAMVHIHLADGQFRGSHAGRSSLLPGTNYILRTRHKDSSGNSQTQWSPYAQRTFRTATIASVLPMVVGAVAKSPLPVWRAGTEAIILPGGQQPAVLRFEGATGAPLMVVSGGSGQNQILTLPHIPSHSPMRVRLSSGGQPVSLPPSELVFTDHEGFARTVYLPQLNLSAGQTSYFWVSSNGSTFAATSSQTTPNFSSVLRNSPIPWNIPPGFTIDVFATGFQLPVNIAFVPNPGPGLSAPLFYVSELYGQIKVVRRDRSVGTFATGLLNYDPGGAFPGSGEQGLTGLAVDPATGDVLASLLYDWIPPAGPRYPKLVRFQSNDGGQTAATQTTILDMFGEQQGASHQVSNVSFGPDGMIYLHVGDGFEVAAALNLDSFRGKILRLRPNGLPPSDNPFYNAGNGISARDYIYAYGFRNPFGGAWRAADGRLYEVENGPAVDRFARVDPGTSYNWDGSDDSMRTRSLHNWEPATAPVNLAFIQPTTFAGSRFPSWMQGHAFVTESGPTWSTGPQALGKAVSEFELDAQGNIIAGPVPFVEYDGAGKATCVGLAAGPDGLYFSDLYKDYGYQTPIDAGSNVLRVRFIGEADFTADVTSGPCPLTVKFTDLSTAPSPSAYLWVFGDGHTSTEANPTHTYTREGRYTVRRRVTGANGAVVWQRNDFIEVGRIIDVAVIGGTIPPAPADRALAEHLTAKGFVVSHYDDDPVLRPTAQELAEHYDAVFISSSVDSANIGGEFRNTDVPLVFSEQGLLRLGREPLSDSGAEPSAATTINIVNDLHPITQGMATGNHTVFAPAAAMSVGRGNIAPGTSVLARRASSSDAAVLAADNGAQLLGGYIAPARRVFLFPGDNGFLAATAEARALLDQSLCWAGAFTTTIVSQPASRTVEPGQPVSFSVAATGAGPMRYQWRRNGLNIPDGGPISGASTPKLTINPVAYGYGGNFDVVITNPCGAVVSNPASLSIGCYPNCDGSSVPPILNIQDFICFQNRYFQGDPFANCDGSTTSPILDVRDFICFQVKFLEGCP